MDEDVWEEIRYYESERDDARWRRDKLEEEIEDLEKKYEKNKELTKQYKKFVSDIKLAQDEISVSESYKKNALNNFNKNFKGELAKEKLKKYNTAFENMSTIKNNLKTCIDEGNTKIQKLAIEKKELERKIFDKKDERDRQINLISYYNRKLESLY